MYTRTMCLSKKRIINHVKRYWWILVIFFIIGLAGSVYSIKQNEENTESGKVAKVYESQVVITLENNAITTPSVMGDCEILLKTESLKEEVNKNLEAEGYEELKTLDNVVLTRVNASNCFILQVTTEQDEESRLIGESVITYLRGQINQYHPGVELRLIEEKFGGEAVSGKSEGVVISLSNILIVMASILAGIFLVYILMVSDHKIITVQEANSILKTENSVTINRENCEDIRDFLKYRKEKAGNICLIFSDESVLKKLGLEQGVNAARQLNEINNSFIEDAEGTEKWLVIKGSHVTSDQLVKLKNLIDLYGEKIVYLIFVED